MYEIQNLEQLEVAEDSSGACAQPSCSQDDSEPCVVHRYLEDELEELAPYPPVVRRGMTEEEEEEEPPVRRERVEEEESWGVALDREWGLKGERKAT